MILELGTTQLFTYRSTAIFKRNITRSFYNEIILVNEIIKVLAERKKKQLIQKHTKTRRIRNLQATTLSTAGNTYTCNCDCVHTICTNFFVLHYTSMIQLLGSHHEYSLYSHLPHSKHCYFIEFPLWAVVSCWTANGVTVPSCQRPSCAESRISKRVTFQTINTRPQHQAQHMHRRHELTCNKIENKNCYRSKTASVTTPSQHVAQKQTRAQRSSKYNCNAHQVYCGVYFFSHFSRCIFQSVTCSKLTYLSENNTCAANTWKTTNCFPVQKVEKSTIIGQQLIKTINSANNNAVYAVSLLTHRFYRQSNDNCSKT